MERTAKKKIIAAASAGSAALLGFAAEELYRYMFCRESSAVFEFFSTLPTATPMHITASAMTTPQGSPPCPIKSTA